MILTKTHPFHILALIIPVILNFLGKLKYNIGNYTFQYLKYLGRYIKIIVIYFVRKQFFFFL